MKETNLEQFQFKIKENKMTLVKYTGQEEKVVIPDEFEGKPVKIIGKEAFSESSYTLREVILPQEVELLEVRAFERCTMLRDITLPSTLIEIKKSAFSDCTSLEEIIFPASLKKVGSFAFSHCVMLKKVVLEGTWVQIIQNTFDECEELVLTSIPLLEQLSLETQVKVLGNFAKQASSSSEAVQKEITDFWKRKINLKNEIFSEGTVALVTFLLENSEKLTLKQVNDRLEDSVEREKTEITAVLLEYKNKHYTREEQESYYENKELVEMGFEPPTLSQFKEKWKCESTKEGILVHDYLGNQGEEIIPEVLANGKKIVEISGGSRGYGYHNRSITHLDIRAQLTTLYNMSRFSSLEWVFLPDSMVHIVGQSTFCDCKKLERVNLPKELKSLPDEMFSGCSSLEQIEIPESVSEIGRAIFADCSALREIVLPEGLTEIPNGAFAQCTSLVSVTLPKNLRKIGEKAFEGCCSLKSIHFPDHEVDMGEGAFAGCSSLVDADGFIVFKETLYGYSGASETVVIPEGVKVIGNNAFQDVNLKEVVLSSTVETVGSYAFECSPELEKVVLNENLKHIAANAFALCISLEPFALPPSLETIGTNSFSCCVKFADEEGFIIIDDRLFGYFGDETQIVVPEGVKGLESKVFELRPIRELTLPSTLRVIEVNAFYDCTELSKIRYPKALEDIGLMSLVRTDRNLPRAIEFIEEDDFSK